MDRTVEVLDLTTLLSDGLWNINSLAVLPAIVTESLSAEVLNGKQLFYDARDPRLAFDRYISCASCHNGVTATGKDADHLPSGLDLGCEVRDLELGGLKRKHRLTELLPL